MKVPRAAGAGAAAPVPAPVRCFVALWPDATTRANLAALVLAEQADGRARRADPQDLHLTLAFIGALDAGDAQRVAAMLAATDTAEFPWVIDRIGSFARARVVWVGGPADSRLEALAQAVRGGLDALQVPYDRKPFAAHVTLLRKAVSPGIRPLALPLHWMVTRPVLVVSEEDGSGRTRYRTWGEPADLTRPRGSAATGRRASRTSS